MPQNNDSIAVMLLCCRMSATRQELFDPLSAQEFSLLHSRLRRSGKTAGWLMGRDIGEIMSAVGVSEQEAHRLLVLMERMVSLSFELDKYKQHGIEVVTCSDRRYPAQLERRLGQNAPPVLYVCGSMSLFRAPSLAFAGSVPGSDESERETETLADRAAAAKVVLVTGATSGLDQTAEFRLRENGGSLIAWLPGGMMDIICREGLGELIAERRAAAVSICHPEAPVLSVNARARSKCLYASGAVSCVIGCDYKRGDTWEGAAEALRSRYTERMYVWDTDLYPGNAMLLKRGAVPLESAEKLDFEQLRARWSRDEGEQLSVFDDRRLMY